MAPTQQPAGLASLAAHTGDRARHRPAVGPGVVGQCADHTMVRLDNVTVSYRQHPALHHVSGHIATGSLTAVVGPNGSGKSTLLKSMLGLVPLAGGRLQVAVPQQRIAYLPQQCDIDRSFPMSVQDCVLLGCWPASGAWGRVDLAQRASVAQALGRVQLQGFEQRPLGALSAG
eukprot:gene16773-34863_t